MLDFQIKDGIARITLQRPEVLNAINREVAERFLACVEDVERRSDVKVVVTRGEGRAFSAGSDLRELAPLSPMEASQYELRFAEIFSTLDRIPQPTIAVLHGHVLGGGLGLALYHDFRIASESASLAMPETGLGWTPPWAVGRLAEVVGFPKARWMLMTCGAITGAQAAEIGLVAESVPDDRLLSRVEELARRFVAMPAEGLARTKSMLNQMSSLRHFEWDAAASEAFLHCYEKPEAQKRIADFLSKKKSS